VVGAGVAFSPQVIVPRQTNGGVIRIVGKMLHPPEHVYIGLNVQGAGATRMRAARALECRVIE
jgi:hypothetical protein